MPLPNPWKSYHQTATLTAPPGQLVLMLYEGAIRFLERAQIGFECTDAVESIQVVHHNIQRALDIIRELNRALDMDRGAECAATLRSLYEYFDRRLLESNVRKDPAPIKEVIQHLTVLRDAWATMLKNPEPSPIATKQLEAARALAAA